LSTLLNLLVRLGAYCPEVAVILPSADRHPLLRLLEGDRFHDALREFSPYHDLLFSTTTGTPTRSEGFGDHPLHPVVPP